MTNFSADGPVLGHIQLTMKNLNAQTNNKYLTKKSVFKNAKKVKFRIEWCVRYTVAVKPTLREA